MGWCSGFGGSKLEASVSAEKFGCTGWNISDVERKWKNSETLKLRIGERGQPDLMMQWKSKPKPGCD